MRRRLIMLPYAGGSEHAYQRMKPALSEHFDMSGLPLPGRGSRYGDPLPHSMESMADAAAETLEEIGLDGSVVWGHSMGALLGYAALSRMQDRGRAMPDLFVVSGANAPQFPTTAPTKSALADAELMEHLKQLGGLPAEVESDPELQAFFLPIIRSDFRCVEGYSGSVGSPRPLHVPLLAFGGTGDNHSEEVLLGWESCSSSFIGLEYFVGGHFFLFDHIPDLCNFILKSLHPERRP